jgi:hypothetical protein
MRPVMQRLKIGVARAPVAGKDDARPQRDPRHPLAPVGAFLDRAFGVVVVSLDDEAGLFGEIEKNSMWQLDSDATNASSGSTPAGSEKGVRTTWGEDEAGTRAPRSKAHSWARL